jgi:hypothetical protein
LDGGDSGGVVLSGISGDELDEVSSEGDAVGRVGCASVEGVRDESSQGSVSSCEAVGVEYL